MRLFVAEVFGKIYIIFLEFFDEKIENSFFMLSDQNLENEIFTKYYYLKYFEVMHEFRGLEIKLR